MDIEIIPHAKARIKLRGITKAMVRDCLENPDRTGEGYLGRKISYKKLDKNQIKVVYENGLTFCVITVMWTNKLK